MSSSTPAADHPYPTQTRIIAVALGFLAPGLGQIYQGFIRTDRRRLSKGVFFLVTLWGMFFYGMWLGEGKNVFLPHQAEQKPVQWFGRRLPSFLGNLYTRLQYAGQFWIGSAAWPALWNYNFPNHQIFEGWYRSPGTARPDDPLVLKTGLNPDDLDRSEAEMNALQRKPGMGKFWDIGWVYTVIAGVLNILVLYDAGYGPGHRKKEATSAPAAEGGTS